MTREKNFLVAVTALSAFLWYLFRDLIVVLTSNVLFASYSISPQAQQTLMYLRDA